MLKSGRVGGTLAAYFFAVSEPCSQCRRSRLFSEMDHKSKIMIGSLSSTVDPISDEPFAPFNTCALIAHHKHPLVGYESSGILQTIAFLKADVKDKTVVTLRADHNLHRLHSHLTPAP